MQEFTRRFNADNIDFSEEKLKNIIDYTIFNNGSLYAMKREVLNILNKEGILNKVDFENQIEKIKLKF